MASAFGHATAGTAIALAFYPPARRLSAGFYFLAAALAILPDADVLGFHFGIEYGSAWGHRGATHSIFFAAIIAFAGAGCMWKWRDRFRISFGSLALCLSCVIFSHALLDAMTTGGLGVGFFTPFYNERYFFGWRPIVVSPIGVKLFFSEWGLEVLKSEAIWIGIPSTLLVALRLGGSRFFAARHH